MTTTTRPPGTMALAVGVVALEFAAAVTTFVASTLLPVIARDLDARGDLGLLLAGSTLGLFVALPLAGRVVRRLGGRRTLAVGMAGYVGADGLITLMLTDGYRTSLARAAVVLSAAPLAWALTSLTVPRLMRRPDLRYLPSFGLALTALGVGTVAVVLAFSRSFVAALVAWTAGGVGVGLAYPGLYIRATTAGTSGLTATGLATAAITAETFGSLLGRAVGGAISSLDTPRGLIASYLVFTAVLGAAASGALRSVPVPVPSGDR